LRPQFISYNQENRCLQFRLIKTNLGDEEKMYKLRQKLQGCVPEFLDMELKFDKTTGIYTIEKCFPLKTFLLNEKNRFLSHGISEQNWEDFIDEMRQQGIILEINHVELTKLPHDFRKQTCEFWSFKDKARLSCLSRLFNNQPNLFKIWKEKLIAFGCDPILVEKTIKTDAIFDYKNLCNTLLLITLADIKKIAAVWELLCLSGEVNAIHYAMTHEGLEGHTFNQCQENPLHLAAWSGNIAAIQCALQIPTLDRFKLSNMGYHVVDFAILSQRVDAIEYSVTIPGIDKILQEHPKNLLFLAAASKNPAVILCVRKLGLIYGLDLDPTAPNGRGHTAISQIESFTEEDLRLELKNALAAPIQLASETRLKRK